MATGGNTAPGNPFQFTWSNGTTGAVNANLPAGTYSLVVDAVDIDQAGSYFVLVTPFVIEDACAPDLFFSEYIESGANKLIEIYNGTGAAVDLADYQIWRENGYLR